MATDPTGPVGFGSIQNVEMGEVSDLDAEGEEEYETPRDTAAPSHADAQSARDAEEEQDRATAAEEEDQDAEGEVDADGEEDEEQNGEAVGPVKMPGRRQKRLSDMEDKDDADGDDDADLDVESAASTPSGASPASESDESESEVENEWEGESEDADDAPDRATDSKPCVYCRQSEEDDPKSEEFEEYLSCIVCGEGSHRQCARDANTLASDEDAANWRCTNCIDDGLEAAPEEESGQRTSVPKLARDLLPVKPDAPSIYNELILPDDPLDGSRALRKRKSSPEEAESASLRSSARKRRRASTAASRSTTETATPRPSSSWHTRSGAAVETDEADDEPVTRSTRPKRSLPQKIKPGASFAAGMVTIRVKNKDKLAKILASRPRPKRRKDRPKMKEATHEEPEASHYPAIETNYQPFFAFTEREDDTKTKPYGGILSEADADTSRTHPQDIDKRRFEEARKKAEEDWKKKMAAVSGPPEPARPIHKMSGPPSKIKCINFGGYEIDIWHAAPYPEEYSRNKVLYICEFCLKYMNSDYVAWRHKLKCPAKHPPGDEIYRDGKYSFFEVDGRKNPVYCQNLCLLAKLFLGSKTLYYDVEPFLFYVMTENNELGDHFVGYFSKEKRPSSLNNVSCILVLPIHQRKGFGHMLIEFSYLLTREEKKTGSPEKPLSDMGLVSYRSYWRLILCYQLLHQRSPLSIAQISERTGMTADDIVSALEGLRALVRDPVTKTYAFRLDHAYYKQYIDKFEEKNWPKINPQALIWTPYVMGRGNSSQYDEGPQLHAVAPREEETNENAVPEEGVQMEVVATAAAEQENAALPESEQARQTDMPDAPAASVNGTDHTDNQSWPSTPKPEASRPTETPIPLPSITPTQHPSTAIPPTRFEVFPPIPGQPATKRRPGRPFGSRRRTTTPLRRSYTAPNRNLPLVTPSRNANTQPRHLNGQTTLRRTRSKLGEIVNGLGDEENERDDEEPDDEEEPEEQEDGNENGNAEDENDGTDNQEEGDEEEEDEDADELASPQKSPQKSPRKPSPKSPQKPFQKSPAKPKLLPAKPKLLPAPHGKHPVVIISNPARATATDGVVTTTAEGIDQDAEGEEDDLDAEGEVDEDAAMVDATA